MALDRRLLTGIIALVAFVVCMVILFGTALALGLGLGLANDGSDEDDAEIQCLTNPTYP